MRKVYEDFKLHICVWCRLAGLVLLCSFLVSCGANQKSNSMPSDNEETSSDYTVAYTGKYDSLDTAAVVITVSKEDKKVTLYNRTVEKQYTLSFDGTSKFYDKYGTSLVAEQLSPGDIVDVTFMKDKKIINSIQKSPDVWTYSDVKNFTVDALSGNIKMMDGDYRFKDTLQIFSDGALATLMDINEVDSLLVSGSGHEVYSIVIDGSHGYLRLKGQDYFVGGWIEIGSGIVKSVSDDMLLTVPVGTYEVQLSNGKYNYSEVVTIEKGKEVLVDVGNMEVPTEAKLGDLIFVTSPEKASVYIDGKEVDTSGPVKIEYGIHQLIVRSSGYDTITQYIKVSKEHATLDITLEKAKNDGTDGNASPSPQVTMYVTPSVMETETTKYRVKVEAPEGAEVFLDGSYVGIVPVDFAKVSGSHTITLRKEGYETRSYTITLDTLLQNESFSFALLKVEEENPSVQPLKEETHIEAEPEKSVENDVENQQESDLEPKEQQQEQTKEPEKTQETEQNNSLTETSEADNSVAQNKEEITETNSEQNGN